MTEEQTDPQLIEEEKAQNEALLGMFVHPGWRIYQMAAEETLFTLMNAYFSFNLKETVAVEGTKGRTIQRYKSMEQLVIEQTYLRGRIDQLKDMLYSYQEQPLASEEQVVSFRSRTWDKMKSLFRRLCY